MTENCATQPRAEPDTVLRARSCAAQPSVANGIA